MYFDLANSGRRRLSTVRTILGAIDGQPPTESELEAMFVRLLERHRLPTPQRQVTFEWSEHESGRVDFWYPDRHLIVELDGRRFHLRNASFERDLRRGALALAHGERTVRFTHLQLTDDPNYVVRVLRSLLAESAAG